MKTIEVKPFQSIFDISEMATGVNYNAVQIAQANNISITDELTPGQILIIPDNLTEDKKILKENEENNIIPATAKISDDIATILNEDENQSPPIIGGGFDPVFGSEFE